MKSPLLLSAFFLLFIQLHTSAQTTVYVNSSTGNDVSGAGTSAAPYKTFHKAYTVAASGDIIDLSGTFLWTAADETGDAVATGYTISKNLTVRGNLSTAAIVQAAAVQNSADRRVFTIASGYTVYLLDLTIRYGYLNTNVNYDGGGGVKNSGTLIVDGCTITQNGVHTQAYQFGGGILNAGSGTLTIDNSSITNNSSSGWGGGIVHGNYGSPGSLTLSNSNISNNTTIQRAGGLMVLICNAASKITNCTFYGNTAGTYGGIFNDRANSTYTNNTIVNNTATGNGGGLSVYANSVYLKNNLMANNMEATSTPNDFRFQTSTVYDNGYNLVEYSNGYTFAGTGDITGNQTNLNISTPPAANSTLNGTSTVALLSGSVAINAGHSGTNNNVTPTSYDQRSYARSSAVDIGAYEYDGIPVYRWKGVYSSDWNTSGNWRSKTVPTGTYSIAFDPTICTNNLHMDQARSISLIDFTVSAYKLVLGNYDLTATACTGADGNSYVQTNGSGTLKMNIAQGGTANFGVGNSAYNPVTITNNSGALDLFSVKVLDEVYLNGVSGNAVADTRVRRTWDIGKTNANGGSGVDFVFNWNNGETSGTLSDPRLFHFSNRWQKQTGTTSTGTNQLTYTGYTGSFSPFAIADQNATLPLTWISFTSRRQNAEVLLNWQTAREYNTADFVVQHSTNGTGWTNIGIVKANNNNAALNSYQFTHTSPADNINHYRILQRDLDGSSSFSKIISIQFNKVNALVILGNPVTNDMMQISLAKAGILRITNDRGQVLLNKPFSQGIQQIDVSAYPKGVYWISNGTEVKKIFIQ